MKLRLHVRLAFWIVARAMRVDLALADTWRANIRSVLAPAMNTRAGSDETTHRLMKRLFGVERPKIVLWKPKPPVVFHPPKLP